MTTQITIANPSELPSALSHLLSSSAPSLHLTINLYAPLEGHYTPHAHAQDSTFGPRLLEPLYTLWTHSIRNASLRPPPLSSSPSISITLPSPPPPRPTQLPSLKITLDITRPLLSSPNATNLIIYETRGLTRITAILQSKLRDRVKAVETVLKGAPCWCVLRMCERSVVLDRGRSWPVRREAHEGGEREGGVLCVRLMERAGEG